MDVWEEESELDAQRIRWWNQYSCTVAVGPEWFLDYATQKGVVKRLREEAKIDHDVYFREHIAPVYQKLGQTLNVLMWDLGIEDMSDDPIGDDFEWERTILFRPINFPGIHPNFK
jgi:hypothetical protein